jgi:hypothetical protein
LSLRQSRRTAQRDRNADRCPQCSHRLIHSRENIPRERCARA